MKIGSQIRSKDYPEYGMGTIIEIDSIGGENYCKVFFDDLKEIKHLKEDSLSLVASVIEKSETRDYDDPLLFSLCLLCEKIEALNYQSKLISANNFNILPLPHQILTVNHVLESFSPRYLIADEVGLGKTIEAALIFEELKLRKKVNRVLILSPSALTMQWRDELKTKFNEDFLVVDREVFSGLESIHGDTNVWENYNQVICSIDFAKPKSIKDSLSEKVKASRNLDNKRITQNLIDAKWDMVIVDEAHHLSKDWDKSETARYKLGKALAESTENLLFLSATPHQGKSEKFLNLLELIDPYKFFDAGSLTPDNVKSVTVKNEKRAVTDLDGNLIFKDRIVQLVKIRRDKSDIESILYENVTDYVSKFYNLALRDNNRTLAFLLIIYQRMVSSSSKAIHESLTKRLNIINNDLNNIYNLKKIDYDEIEDINLQEAYDKIISQEIKEDISSGVDFSLIEKDVVKEMNILEDCVKIAKKASTGRQDAKIVKLLEIIDEVIAREGIDTKFIIFTEFIKTQEYIGEILENYGYKVSYFNGKMSLDEKIGSKSKFKDDHQFLISTDSGGEGINLQFAHVMINYDLPWNPMKIEQRIGRIDRIGQEKDVLVFNFVIEDTIEERVRDILDRKLDIISNQFGDDKKRDVLSLLNEDFNFDKLFIEAVRKKEVKTKELQEIGNKMNSQAKNIIENQQLLIPFSQKKEENPKKYILDDTKLLIENLVRAYLRYKHIDLIEYSNKKNVYYLEKPIKNYRCKNLVFDKKISLENEKYEYLNLSHPLIKMILNEITSFNSLSFDLKINNYTDNINGTLFLYSLKLTNNEDFIRKHLIPVFINSAGDYDEKVSNWFVDDDNFNIKMDFEDDIGEALKDIKIKAEKIKDQKIKDYMINTRMELYEKLEKEKEKYDVYFKKEEKEINKRGIENIRESILEQLNSHKNQLELDRKKRKELVPQVELFAIAEITLNDE
ncbi:MAG: DEAD/DEAH box helicase family protein [Methanobrevibacter sp.]|jgi:SNF2 family DNA or RNA helicase|nr:DEAD/DEAH box helicase family protein [Candidatus Methanoflexus mossambicus]